MMQRFRLGVAQSPAELFGQRERIDWLTGELAAIEGQDIDLLLLPELFLTGYNIGRKIYDWAERSDGPFAKEIAGLAKRFRLAIHYGYAERGEGVIYNSAQCFGPDGARLGGHRKLILPPGFETDYFARGHGCSVFEYRGLKVGTLICYDAEFPETARHVAALGADIILVPTALGAQWDWVSRTLIPARGYENGVFLAYANHAGNENGLEYLGMSFVTAPNGEELVRLGAKPEILVTDLEVSLVAKAQERLPYLRDCHRFNFTAVNEDL